MSKDKEKTKEKSGKFINFLLTFFMLIALICSGFAIYEIFLLSGIESLIRYIVIGVFALIDLFIILKVRKYKKGKKKKKPRKGLFIFFLIIYSIITFGIGGAIFYIYGKLNGLNKETITYTSNLLVMSDNEAEEIADVEDMTIGILSDKKSPEGYIIPQEIIKENNLNDTNEMVDYDDYTTM